MCDATASEAKFNGQALGSTQAKLVLKPRRQALKVMSDCVAAGIVGAPPLSH